MKTISLLLLLLSPFVNMNGPTAEEILWKTEHAYRALSNYVEQGSLIIKNPYYSLMGPGSSASDTLWYFLAMDKRKNVGYWFRRTFGETIYEGSYYKTEKETKGICHSPFVDGPGIICSMPEAVVHLSDGEKGRLSLIGSLMYPDFSPDSPGDSSVIQYFDTASRLEDTTINGSQCFVVYTQKTKVISQALADRLNFEADSAQGMLELPPEQRGRPKIEAGPRTNANKYYIRKRDFILLRVEYIFYKIGTKIITSKSPYDLNPRLNVKNFKKYLEDKEY